MIRPLLLTLLACALTAAQSVELAAPLTTVVPVSDPLPETPGALTAVLVVPADAPEDLGVGAFVADDDGQWYQRLHSGVLGPGRHELRFAIDGGLHGEPHRGGWTPHHARLAHRAGLFLWSASASRATIVVESLAVTAAEPAEAAPASDGPRLDRLEIDGASWTAQGLRLEAGARLELRCRPQPFPRDPYDHEGFRLQLTVQGETDPEPVVVSGFYHQPMALHDRGDIEAFSPSGPAGFALRHRIAKPGRYRLWLQASWPDGRSLESELPPLVVDGEPWGDFVQVDPHDPRFFSTADGRFVWPIGINARSVNDPRGAARTGSRLSPDRRWHSYAAYLERWAAAGMTGAEIWMSSWNLALEWRGDWPGFDGVGSYSQVNAQRLDHLLDRAHELGLRINLVINNHGQASAKTDAEWQDNPYNLRLRDSSRPGTIRDPGDFFTAADALAGQERLRRYIIARYASHPAILGWKLWTEQNLTGGRQDDLRAWHVQAAERWHALDPYRHPVTTHWSGNYRTPDRAIVAQPGMDYICIDAYHGRSKDRHGQLFADLAWEGLHHRWHGLGQFRKPIVITEYGGNWDACPEPQLISEHHHGPWACLVSGYAASPMLWWLEWVDQGARYGPYTAIARFLVGEDLRSRPGSAARAVELQATAGERALWCRAWSRPGRILGYLLDPAWGYDGSEPARIAEAAILIGNDVRSGPVHVQWWDAETGAIIEQRELPHPGGALRLTPPPFTRHLGFKLWRLDQADG